jgi:penicillin-binding protein-related factor A (putative recombinase)
MAKTDLGKKWEAVFEQSWQEAFPEELVFRLRDQMTGYKESSENPCDYLCHANGKLFMVECKTHKGASIPFTAIPQYERLLKYKNKKDVLPGVIIWFSEKDSIIWVGINEMEKMVLDGEKSIGLRMLEKKLYNIIEVPFEKKRVYLFPDCKFLLDKLIN